MSRKRNTLASLALSSVLLVSTFAPPSLVQVGVITTTGILVTTQVACGPDTLEKLNHTLNQVVHSLEAAVDTNGQLYEKGAYGVKGSPGAIEMRQRVATVIHNSNEYLIEALNIAKGLTKQTFEGSKLLILEKLSQAASGLKIGQTTIDLILQSVAALINQAVSLAQLFQSSDVRHIQRIVPALDELLKSFGHIREINSGLEVFAE